MSLNQPPESRPTVIVMQNKKEPLLAAALAFFFGPLGLLYSSPIGALVMFGVNLVVFFITFGFGLILTWPVCAVWGYLAAKAYNDKLAASAQFYR